MEEKRKTGLCKPKKNVYIMGMAMGFGNMYSELETIWNKEIEIAAIWWMYICIFIDVMNILWQ